MNQNHADVTILGAGPVGSALALLLARVAPDPARIHLCRLPARALPSDQPTGLRAARTLALNHGSRTLLEGLGAWPAHGASIHTIHVSQRGRLGRTLIRREDFNVPELGTVHPYDRLQATLEQAIAHSGITVRTGPPALIAQEDTQGVHLVQGETTWRSGVVVQAEGSPAAGMSQDGASSHPPIEREYGQHAILGLVSASQPSPGWAWERFTRQGPLALLPIQLPEAGLHHAYSLVWCCHPDEARRLAALDDYHFATELNTVFGSRMGHLQPLSPRAVHPLRLRWRRDVLAGRRVLIGNAAQTLHPVAGQGLNLGLRDAAQLAHHLAPWLVRAQHSPLVELQGFVQRRRNDRLLTGAVTDFLPRIFSTGFAPVEHACGLALLALDTLPLLRRPLAQHLMLGLRS